MEIHGGRTGGADRGLELLIPLEAPAAPSGRGTTVRLPPVFTSRFPLSVMDVTSRGDAGPGRRGRIEGTIRVC
jgi:hypothetical protein